MIVNPRRMASLLMLAIMAQVFLPAECSAQTRKKIPGTVGKGIDWAFRTYEVYKIVSGFFGKPDLDETQKRLVNEWMLSGQDAWSSYDQKVVIWNIEDAGGRVPTAVRLDYDRHIEATVRKHHEDARRLFSLFEDEVVKERDSIDLRLLDQLSKSRRRLQDWMNHPRVRDDWVRNQIHTAHAADIRFLILLRDIEHYDHFIELALVAFSPD